MVEECVAEQQDAGFSCEVLEVSRSGYYAWLRRLPSVRQTEDERIWQKIKKHWEMSRKTYGSPRITAKLRSDGELCGKKRVARIMRDRNIQGACKKKIQSSDHRFESQSAYCRSSFQN